MISRTVSLFLLLAVTTLVTGCAATDPSIKAYNRLTIQITNQGVILINRKSVPFRDVAHKVRLLGATMDTRLMLEVAPRSAALGRQVQQRLISARFPKVVQMRKGPGIPLYRPNTPAQDAKK